MSVRYFTCGRGLVLTLPLGLKAAPGARPFRLDDKTTVAIDMDEPGARSHARFVACALRDGDLVETKGPATDVETPTQAAPGAPSKFAVNAPKE